jgi:hypothetical protein
MEEKFPKSLRRKLLRKLRIKWRIQSSLRVEVKATSPIEEKRRISNQPVLIVVGRKETIVEVSIIHTPKKAIQGRYQIWMEPLLKRSTQPSLQ